MLYRDRRHAGAVLAERLAPLYEGRRDLLVLALPRGGVPVGYEVARRLGAPLDVFVVRKLGVPGQEELAMGAIASGGVRVLNEDVVEHLGLDERTIDAVAAREAQEIERQERAFRDNWPPPDVRGKTVILVDDGLATGSTMRAAVQALRQLGPREVVVGVPVGTPETCAEFQDHADLVVCAAMPERLYSVGLWYDDFGQTSDEEVRQLLAAARGKAQRAAA